MHTRSAFQAGRPVLGALLLAGVAACARGSLAEPEPGLPPAAEPAGAVVRLESTEAARRALAARESASVQLAPGLDLTLWASERLIHDPVAISFDERGVLYAVQTQRDGRVLDIRRNRDWMVASLAMRTVEDRRAFIRRELAPERSAANVARTRDLSQDGSHDWRDLAVTDERIFRIMDTDGDGRADFSQLMIEAFGSEVTDVASGLLAHDGELFMTAAPDVWRLRDRNGDGLIDTRESISHGYMVHIGYGGHGLMAATLGPDGRIYWSVGDIGMDVTDREGRRWSYPNQGAILRSNPDGTGFEVFAAGMRNAFDIAFDDYGNLITVDNDGDHQGETERIVYVTSGHEGGWRIHWQFGKYTDPSNNAYKVWMDERMYEPRFEGQAAWFTPPVAAYHSGPAGMAYNPGTALGERWREHFFVSEFTGTASRSRVHAFRLDAAGAGFRLAADTVVVSGILTTGLEFGPDGALYLADWIQSYDAKGEGRIWKVDTPAGAVSPLRAETRTLIASRFTTRPTGELRALLSHADQRVRLKAQFELARRGDVRSLAAVARGPGERLGRVHALWGIAQVARRDARQGALLLPFLSDADAEVRAQAAKQLGDVRHAAAAPALLPLLRDPAPRARFFAAEALGRLAHAPAVDPLIELVVENDDRDVYLRHAAVAALARIGRAEPLAALARHPSRAARVAAVVALRRMRDPAVAAFLGDADEYVVAEAARAINDDGGIEGALPALARLLEEERFRGEPLLRRAINANLRVGTSEAARRVAAYAARPAAPEAMRVEALATLGVWPNPSVLDRVDGIYRGARQQDTTQVRAAVMPLVEPLFAGGSAAVRAALARTLGQLGAREAAPALLARLGQDPAPEVRLAALQALQAMGAGQVQEAVRLAAADRDAGVRSAALAMLPTLGLPEAASAEVLARVVGRGTVAEQQSAIEALGRMRAPRARELLGSLLDELAAGRLDPGVELELEEAVRASGAAALQPRLQRHQAAKAARGPVASFRDALHGGNARRGNELVLNSTSGQCVRCHSITDGGVDVGPNLRGVGTRLSREQILEALVAPSARIAPGYGVVSLTLANGESVAGRLREESATHLVVEGAAGAPRRVAKSEVARRVDSPSAMPPMNALLSRREIRDVLEYLATLR